MSSTEVHISFPPSIHPLKCQDYILEIENQIMLYIRQNSILQISTKFGGMFLYFQYFIYRLLSLKCSYQTFTSCEKNFQGEKRKFLTMLWNQIISLVATIFVGKSSCSTKKSHRLDRWSKKPDRLAVFPDRLSHMADRLSHIQDRLSHITHPVCDRECPEFTYCLHISPWPQSVGGSESSWISSCLQSPATRPSVHAPPPVVSQLTNL